MRMAVVRDSDGLVVNVIEYDPVISVAWPVPAGHRLIEAQRAGPGETWDGAASRPAPKVPRGPTQEQQEYAAATPDEQRRIMAKRLGLLPP